MNLMLAKNDVSKKFGKKVCYNHDTLSFFVY
jgi:hypothetical protein